jgi:hypothetical protein
MHTAAKLGVFTLGLAVAFGAALGVGQAVGPFGDARPVAAGSGHGGHGPPAPGSSAASVTVPGGLQVAQDGYRLSPVTTSLAAGQAGEFAFRVLGPDGAPVTHYTPTHERDLHLIVVRRDLSGFQHVHPTLGGDGLWRVPLTVATPGQYRVFADFQPHGRDRALTLGVDVPAAGEYTPQPLPAAQPVTQVDGYTIWLHGELVPGTASKLTLEVSRDGRPVTDLQSYLGAYGHLVALRDGDLAYLHVHPDGQPGDGRTPAGPQVSFYAEVPSAGTYRLYLDFQHGGVVHTAEFTVTAGASAAPSTGSGPAVPAPASSPTGSTHGHDGGHGGEGS